MEENLKTLLESLKETDENNTLKEPQNEQVIKLAFVGDTIFDLFTRDYLIKKYAKTLKVNDLHKKNVELVCAKSQSKIVDILVDSFLNQDEIDYFKHSRNAHSKSKSKNSSIVEYRKATGLEALLGLLFYKNSKRLLEVLTKIKEIILNEGNI